MRTVPRLVCAALLAFACLDRGVLPTARAGTDPVSVFVEPDAHLAPILSLIRSARHSIRLEVYLLTNASIIAALSKAETQGVNVRVLLEERPYGAVRYAALGYDHLRAVHVPVRWANESAFTYTHEKSMVIDGTTAGIFTLNLSSSGLYSNREFGVIDHDAADAHILATVFDADWARRRVHISSSRMVISPDDSRTDLTRLIDSARRTLDLYAEEVADTAMENHLIAARRRHVRVRLITSTDSPGVETLRHAGIGVTIMVRPYVHAKAIVADGRTVFIGSENLSPTSLDHNREAGIILNDPDAAVVVERTFASDWRGGPATAPLPAPPVSHTSSGQFSVRVSTSPTSLRRDQTLTISAVTKPGATCSVRVTYPDGYVSRARALAESERAGSDGRVHWSWRMGSTATGTGRADVTCTSGGATASGSATFVVT